MRIDFFVRNEPENITSWEQVENLGIEPRLINNLHAKFYLSENSGVISSMNLLSSSNSSSIEIGCKLDAIGELEELKLFIKDFLITNEIKERPGNEDLYLVKEKFLISLQNAISKRTNKNSRILYSRGQFTIKVGGTSIDLSIDKLKNTIKMDYAVYPVQIGFLSKELALHFKSNYFKYDLFGGGLTVDSFSQGKLVACSRDRLSNSFLDKLRLKEKKVLISEITEHIYSVIKFKAHVRENLTTLNLPN